MPSLKIECTNLRNQAGQVVVVVWDNADDFRSDDGSKAVTTVTAAASGETVVLDAGDLPAGDYAVAILHDENENSKLDLTPALELPTEGVGFSNNPRMGLKGPDWASCSFSHQADETISIAFKYWR